jgi:hypothetical protein
MSMNVVPALTKRQVKRDRVPLCRIGVAVAAFLLAVSSCPLARADDALEAKAALRVSYDFWNCLRIWIYEHHGADPGNWVSCGGEFCYEGEKHQYLNACMARKGWIPASRADPDFWSDRVVTDGTSWWRRASSASP